MEKSSQWNGTTAIILHKCTYHSLKLDASVASVPRPAPGDKPALCHGLNFVFNAICGSESYMIPSFYGRDLPLFLDGYLNFIIAIDRREYTCPVPGQKRVYAKGWFWIRPSSPETSPIPLLTTALRFPGSCQARRSTYRNISAHLGGKKWRDKLLIGHHQKPHFPETRVDFLLRLFTTSLCILASTLVWSVHPFFYISFFGSVLERQRLRHPTEEHPLPNLSTRTYVAFKRPNLCTRQKDPFGVTTSRRKDKKQQPTDR